MFLLNSTNAVLAHILSKTKCETLVKFSALFVGPSSAEVSSVSRKILHSVGIKNFNQMACNASKAPFMRLVASRGFAAQAAAKAGAGSEVQSCTLPNKLTVAASESNLPVSRVSILYRAGARNESYENLGASHMMRIAAGLSNKRSTGFAVTRNIQQIGGSLTVTSDREVIAYTVEATSDNIETGLRFLQDVATQPDFKPWELSDSLPLLKTDLASVSDQVRAIELLHKAAYRTGLGNSVFCPEYHVGKLSGEALQHYVNANYTSNRCAVVGVGVDLRTLSGYAQDFTIGSGDGNTSESKYIGGELRCDKAGNRASVAIAGNGGTLANLKEIATFAVLAEAAGTGRSCKYGNVNGVLGKAVNGAAGDASFEYTALNANYTDGGLFGFVVSVDARRAGKVVDAAVKAMKSGNVTTDDVARAKAIVKTSILCNNGTDGGRLNEMGLQAVLTGDVKSTDELIAAVDSVSQADVSSALKKAASDLSMGAVGNLLTVPYRSDL